MLVFKHRYYELGELGAFKTPFLRLTVKFEEKGVFEGEKSGSKWSVCERARGAAGKQKKYQLPAAAECAALVAAKARLDRASPAVWLEPGAWPQARTLGREKLRTSQDRRKFADKHEAI